ncbi:M16 family metallopeptidase [Legionella bononiensis]|uniref:Insulinase family protein n=1 Tax=Legionella bononiensis TaxID=2793102 RepID=A0ABS1W9R4_9GAMM|nr:pitrilysin family protein [Legionella bononiensis]MBL7480703.1 insulinase family protein [Legionella bononiensis]MBL7526098.1 insulinase family protein [Legionella bononiensis]MBL7563407.1 insulinase family protein [Legionella bononiensis]
MRHFNALITALIVLCSQNVGANTFKTEKWLTKNGVQVVFYQAMEVPMLDISMAFAAGSAYDGTQYGLSALTAHLMNQGNGGKDATAVAEALADTGAQFDAETSRDMTVFSLRTLTRKDALEQSTQVFNQIINHPDFPDEAFENEKQQQLMAVEQVDESPDDVASLNFFQTLYQEHPYAHPVNGTIPTLSGITKKHVVEFYKNYYVTNNAVLVMVGALDNKQAHQLAEQLTQDLQQGKSAGVIPKANQLSNAEQINIPFPSSQTVVRLGQIGIDHHNPNYFPLIVGNYILGGGALVSRLAVEVREKRGLTYGVDSQFVPMPGEGPFIISLSTKNDQATNALDITHNTLNRFISNGPSKEELDSAKKYLTGSFPLSLASNRNIAGLLLRMAFYHLPDNYLDTYVQRINAVTHDEIKQAFKEQVNPDKLLLVTVGQS